MVKQKHSQSRLGFMHGAKQMSATQLPCELGFSDRFPQMKLQPNVCLLKCKDKNNEKQLDSHCSFTETPYSGLFAGNDSVISGKMSRPCLTAGLPELGTGN